MSTDATISFHGTSHLELTFGETRIIIDPALPRTRRGRGKDADLGKIDYLLLTRGGETLEDALDVLEVTDDTAFVAAPPLVREARRELGLDRDRCLDLEPWERASDEAVRVTALPCVPPSPLDDGLALVEELTASAGLPAVRSLDDLPESLQRSPLGRQALRNVRALGRLRGGLMDLQAVLDPKGTLGAQGVSGAQGSLAYLFEISGGPTVLHLANGIHEGTDERDLEEIADLAGADVALVELAGSSVGAVVRAMRILQPGAVVFYRSVDPYRRGRRFVSQPSGNDYLDALEEDQGEDFPAMLLRAGDRYTVEERPAEETGSSANGGLKKEPAKAGGGKAAKADGGGASASS